MEVRIQHLGNVRFAAIARGHRVICDQSPGNGGDDTGMTPPELLLASLGTCAAFYAAQYLKNHSLPDDDLEVHVSAEKLKPPARVGRFHIEVQVPELEERHLAGVLRAVKACVIHNTLMDTPEIETEVKSRAHSAVG